MDLFELERDKHLKKDGPLSSRIRPTSLEDFAGQEDIVGKNKLLYRAIKADKITSIILYGPPGTGKTTLAKIIANTTKSDFVQLNATTSGIKDIKGIVEEAKSTLGLYGKKTILFVDEIHRFNKSQQDSLLPHVEDGIITLIGATTENPYFEVNKALVSRSTIFQLKKLQPNDIKKIVEKALTDKENGLGIYKTNMDEKAMEFLCNIAGGDGRVALNAIELAVLTTDPESDGTINITVEVIEGCVQRRSINYDKDGDNHYDTISAFIKSMRGSDPDAAVYYLARMLYAGEDIKFIARRIVICAAEDVGNANPKALEVAVAAAQGADFIGMPEARILLSQAAIYVASSPKSNSCYMAIDDAMEDVKNIGISTIPPYLKDSHYSNAGDLGHGIGYKYPHSFENSYVEQQYLPDEVKNKKYYKPTNNGAELNIKKHLRNLKGENNEKC